MLETYYTQAFGLLHKLHCKSKPNLFKMCIIQAITWTLTQTVITDVKMPLVLFWNLKKISELPAVVHEHCHGYSYYKCDWWEIYLCLKQTELSHCLLVNTEKVLILANELLPSSQLLSALYKVSKLLNSLCVTSQKEAFLTSYLSCKRGREGENEVSVTPRRTKAQMWGVGNSVWSTWDKHSVGFIITLIHHIQGS